MQETGLLEHSKLLRLLLFLTICMCIFNNPISAQNYPDPKVNSMIWSGIGSLLQQDYDSSFETFRTLTSRYPGLPLGYIYMSAVRIAEAADYEEPFDEQFIESNLEKSEQLSRKLINQDKNNAWNYYYLAISKGYLAYFKALKESYVSAFSEGLSSISSFEKCLAIDSSFYDAYIALGAYKYWKSEKTEYLHWLPFVSDERDYGIKLLNHAVRHKTYNHYLALNSLLWIYVNKKQPSRAVSIARRGLKDYPGSRFFRWGLARALQDIDKRKAISEYYVLLQSVNSLPRNNHYNQIVIMHKIAQLYRDLGQRDEALDLCNQIIQTKNLKPYVVKKLEDRMDRVYKLRKELSGR